MPNNILNFPGVHNNSVEIQLETDECLANTLTETQTTHHTEIFAYNDDSYIVLIQPKNKEFSVERIVFMAERLKMEMFDVLPECDDNEDELG